MAPRRRTTQSFAMPVPLIHTDKYTKERESMVDVILVERLYGREKKKKNCDALPERVTLSVLSLCWPRV